MRRLAERVGAVVVWAAACTWGVVFVLEVVGAEPIKGWWTRVGLVTIAVIVGVVAASIYTWYDALR